MKRVITTIVIFLSLFASSTNATTLKIATLAPDGTYWMKSMRQAAKTIQQETEGRVKLKFFPGGVQGSDQSVLRKMRIGQLQGGAVANGVFAKLAPASQLYSLPFTFNNLEELHAIRPDFDQHIIDGLADKGYIVLGMSEAGFAYMMSNKEIRSSDDMRKRKVWSPEGDIVSKVTFENGDVDPIMLPIADVYTSLQTGLIDTIAVNPTSAIALQWHTKLNYATDYPLVFLMGMLVIDQRAFKKVSEADQVIVRKIIGDTFDAMSVQNAKDEASARNALVNNGMSFLELSDDDKRQWKGLAEEALKELAEEGVYPVDVYTDMTARISELRNSANE